MDQYTKSNYVHECSCGRKWAVSKHKSPMRDKDNEKCDCGLIIVSWDGGVYYTAEEIKK